MPRYGIEYQQDGKKFSRETTAKSEEENKAIIDKFNLKEKGATSHEILYTEKTDIVK